MHAGDPNVDDQPKPMSLSVLIQTFNEELNLPHTLASLAGWCDEVFVVDSGSTDRTREIAESFDAKFVHHDWEGYAGQKNWALKNLPMTGDWVLIIDADEAVTPELRDLIVEIASGNAEKPEVAGYYINRLFIFNGASIRHCGYYPSWNLRLFKRGTAEYEDRLVHEHMVVDGPVDYLPRAKHLLHEDRRGLEHFYAKHNRYSTLEARQMYDEPEDWPGGNFFKNRIVRLRFIKSRVMPWVPLPWLWRFLYMYIIRLGILDGRAGLGLSSAIAVYEHMVHAKFRELKRLKDSGIWTEQGLATGEGGVAVQRISEADRRFALDDNVPDELPEVAVHGNGAATNGTTSRGAKQLQTRPYRPQVRRVPQLGNDDVAAKSPWTFGQNVKRVLWMATQGTAFRLSFHNWYGWRRFLLRLFGAEIGKHVRVRPSAHIEIPWNVEIDDHAMVGDSAILYSLGKITIGKRVVISQYAHLCAGTHDFNDPEFPLLRPPITVGDEAWVAADAFVGPNVTIGDRAIVGARSSVFKNVPDGKIAGGNPAKILRDREPAKEIEDEEETDKVAEPEAVHA
ncbi:MAG: WcaF family extracellular polysaccharide biosynthesis acetyltransferase [Planctomycetota bacterium]